MKKIISFVGSGLTYLYSTTTVLAQDAGRVEIKRPEIEGKKVGFGTLGDFVQKTLTLAFMVAVLVVLGMLIWGAFEWITSGGDKDAVAKARNRIISALIGLAVLAVTFALFQAAGQFLGFNVLNFVIPSPAQ